MKLSAMKEDLRKIKVYSSEIGEIFDKINKEVCCDCKKAYISKYNKDSRKYDKIVINTIDENRSPNIGFKGDYIIVLSLDGEYWNIGCFWQFGTPRMGGMRQSIISTEEMNRVAIYVGDLLPIINIAKGREDKVKIQPMRDVDLRDAPYGYDSKESQAWVNGYNLALARFVKEDK